MARPDYAIQWRESAAVYELEDQLEDATIEWFKKFNSGDEKYTKAYKQRISEYTARCHVKGISFERMLILSKLYLVFTIFDDFIAHNPKISDELITSILDIARNNEIVIKDVTVPENYLLSAWSDVWQSISSLSPKHWQKHLIVSIQCWCASMKIENAIVESKVLLSYTEYHCLRLISVVADICIVLIESVQDDYLTNEERANSTLALLLMHAKTIVYLTNDLYSWPKEKRVGDIMNIMYLHQKHTELSEEEAIAAVVKKINEELDAMYCIMDNYSALMPLGAESYLTALSRFVRGNYDFFRSCPRYD